MLSALSTDPCLSVCKVCGRAPTGRRELTPKSSLLHLKNRSNFLLMLQQRCSSAVTTRTRERPPTHVTLSALAHLFVQLEALERSLLSDLALWQPALPQGALGLLHPSPQGVLQFLSPRVPRLPSVALSYGPWLVAVHLFSPETATSYKQMLIHMISRPPCKASASPNTRLLSAGDSVTSSS